ncbi:hypothetical protein ACAN107058_22625 [Paracidovorax anthurii]
MGSSQRSAGSSCASPASIAWIIEGTLCSTVTACSRTHSSSARGSRATSSGTISTQAPHSRPASNCQTETSKLTAAVWAITSCGPRPRYGILPSWLLSMPCCVTTTPLGSPVEPEV